MSSFLESSGLFQALPHCQYGFIRHFLLIIWKSPMSLPYASLALLAFFASGFSMLCCAWGADKEADRDPLALALEILQPRHGSAIPVQRGQAWQVPRVPFQQWFWSSCVAFPVGLPLPTPGLGRTVITSSLWDVAAAVFLKVVAHIRGYTLLHTYSMSFPRYLKVPCVYWITEQSVSGSLNNRRTALPKCSLGDFSCCKTTLLL